MSGYVKYFVLIWAAAFCTYLGAKTFANTSEITLNVVGVITAFGGIIASVLGFIYKKGD